jgi:hypothetical protein
LTGIAQDQSAAVTTVAEAATVKKLVDELFDAEQSSKNQTVQDLRDKLNDLREKMGDDKLKALLNKLLEEAESEGLRELIERLLKLLFPSDDGTPPAPGPTPSPPPRPGGGGGGGRVNPSDFGTVESMSSKPFTSGANYADYKVDKSNPGKKPGLSKEAGNIWSGFRQGPDGNCTTVAAIKAAMMKFGQKPTDIFSDVRANGDGWDVQMRDGFQLSLSKSELQQAAQQARFLGDDASMMTDANFLYAASAKRAHIEGNQGWGHGNDHNAQRSYMDALVSLNDGEELKEGLDRLGLKGLYDRSSSDELARGALGVVAYGGHAMAAIGGQVELWGGRGGRPREGEAYKFKRSGAV